MKSEGPTPPSPGSVPPGSANAFIADQRSTSGRDKAEATIEALRREGGLFVEAVRATRMAMAVTDPSQPGNPIVFANEAFLQLSGYSMDEVLGQQPHFMDGAGTDPQDAGRFREMLAAGRDDVVETVQYGKDGRPFTASVLLSAFRDDAGLVIHHFLSWLDISRRVDAENAVIALRAAQHALRASETTLETELHRTRMLHDLALRMVGEEDVDTIYRDILATAVAILGADAGTVQVYEPESRSLVLLVTQGIEPGMAEHFRYVDASSHTACGIALCTGQRTFVDFDTPPMSEDSRLHVQAGLNTAQATPLLSRGGTAIGMLNTHWRARNHRTSDDQLRFLDLLARQAADLIEQRRAQAALRISEDRLRQFGEASQDVIWIRDATTLQWTYLTPAFESIYGLSRTDAMAGNNYEGWMNLVLPQDRERVAGCIERARSGECVTFDYRIRRPSDGAVRWLRDTDFPILDGGGNVTMVGGIGHDFTELRETELRLKTLVQGIPQLVWRATEPGEWTWASPQWESFTGQPQAESQGWGWLDALHPDDRGRAREAWMQALEKQGFEVDFRLCHAGQGEYRWFQTRATPVRSEAGTIIEWLGTSTDVDELRQLQERQQVLVGELQHRTRNLMSVVKATADRTGASSEDFAQFRHSFGDRLEALARVQALLSRLSDADRISFDELIRSELGALHGTDDRVTLSGPPGIRLRSSMVQTLAMALHELATNAVKYGALCQPGGHLSVTWGMAEPDRKGRPRLHIEWRESGVRMPPPGSAPQGSGQGRELIEKALPYQLNAETRLQMTADGVLCTITVPVSERTPQEATAVR